MILAIEGEDLRALRDRALLAIGMTGALRHSELVAIQREHIEFLPDEISIALGRSKTDQTGKGATIFIPRGEAHYGEPSREVADAAAIVGGPVFLNWTPQGRLSANAMSAHGAELDIKAAAPATGYDPSCFSGHSLGAGFLPEPANESEDLFSMKTQSRYKTTEVLAGYVRGEDGFKTSAAWKFS